MSQSSQDQPNRAELLRMTAQIASAYVGKNPVSSGQLPDVIKAVYASMAGLDTPAAAAGTPKPAVALKKSITPDYIVCLEDGKKLKMLKRHLRTAYGLTPEQYRQKWGLPADYPMVAPNYAEQRSVFAKKIGLGRKPGQMRKGRGRK
jgi:predicted transcriptional regulator